MTKDTEYQTTSWPARSAYSGEVCGHDDCIYFRMRGGIFFCEFTSTTGFPRNCEIADCDEYKSEENMMNNAQENGIQTATDSKPPENPTIQGNTDNPKKKRTNWNDVFAEIDKGIDESEVCTLFGVTTDQLKQARHRRTHAAKKARKKATMESVYAHAPPPTPDAENSVSPPPASPVKTFNECRSINNQMKKDVVEEAYARVQIVMDSCLLKDRMELKAAALNMVHEIIEQASDRIKGIGA